MAPFLSSVASVSSAASIPEPANVPRVSGFPDAPRSLLMLLLLVALVFQDRKNSLALIARVTLAFPLLQCSNFWH
jgi:hypothetical protein